jgi:DinB superfamily
VSHIGVSPSVGCGYEGSERELTMTTTHAGLSVSDPQAYRESLFKLLGDRDPLEVLEQTAVTLADVVRSNSVAALRTRPFADNWTPNEVIGHLVDSEWVYGYRLRLILCEPSPAILGTNQNAWVVRQEHNQRDPSELVETFRTLRVLNLAAWKRLSPADLTRTGQHNERGQESLAVMLRMMAGHDLSHLNQIIRYLEAVRPRD